MQKIYKPNGLVIWTEQEILLRESMVNLITSNLELEMKKINKAFEFVRVEVSQITPIEFINKNYSEEDYFALGDGLVLRPETTMGSYEYAKGLLNPHNKPKYSLPLVVRQFGKSFRKEQDTVVANMRLKEFYQLEFQIIYSNTTDQDYHSKVVVIVKDILRGLVGDCYTIESDRLPDYSEKTTDIQFYNNDMELASISLRKDFERAKVVEVAIGMDRLVYNHYLPSKTF
jgi:histidyl-tRNA synthetase